MIKQNNKYLLLTVKGKLTVCRLFLNVSCVTSQYTISPLLLVLGLHTRVPVTLYVFEFWSNSELVVNSLGNKVFPILMDIFCSGLPPIDIHIHVSGVPDVAVVGPVNVGGWGIAVNSE